MCAERFRAYNFNLFLVVLLCSGLLSGCSNLGLAGIKNLIASDADRQQSLAENVEVYHQAVYWRDGQKASLFVDPEVRSSFVQDLAARRDDEKLVEIKVEKIEFSEDARKALVSTKTKFYKIPSYQVNNRFEKEFWEFDRKHGGWINTGIEEVEEPLVTGFDELLTSGRAFRGRLNSLGSLDEQDFLRQKNNFK